MVSVTHTRTDLKSPTDDSCCRNESFVFAAGALTPKLFAWIHDHKTLGKDKELGAGEIDVSSPWYSYELG